MYLGVNSQLPEHQQHEALSTLYERTRQIASSAAADRIDAKDVRARLLEMAARRTYDIGRERMEMNAGLPPARNTPHSASSRKQPGA